LSEEISEVTETVQNVQDLYKKLSSYLIQARKNPSDTDISVQNLNFGFGKKGKEYSINMEFDFSLKPKNIQKK